MVFLSMIPIEQPVKFQFSLNFCMKTRSLIIALGSLLVLVAVYLVWSQREHKIPDAAKKMEASIRFGWIASGSFAGEVSGMNLFAEKHNLSLKCEPGGPGLNSIQMVETGRNTFGTLAADEILAANDKGADFVIIGVINYNSPAGFVSLEKTPLSKPSDFVGKKVGFLPFGSLTLLYESMLKKNGVDRKKVTEITTSSDLKPFISGAYDVHPVFVYDETVELEKLGLRYNLFEPKNFGVNFKGPCYFCKRETFEKNPELVKAFVYTVADGWNYALKHPKEAISFLKKLDSKVDSEREEKVLVKGISYFSAYMNQPVNSDMESWKDMITELKTYKVITKDVDINSVVKLGYIQEYYGRKSE